MSKYLRQSTAGQKKTIGPFVDDEDFVTLEDGLTIANTDIKLAKDGGTSVNKNSGGATNTVNGTYSVTFDATDSNTVGELAVSVKVAGALVYTTTFTVLEPVVFDALFADGADGELPADVVKINGATTALGNLEDMYDGTGYLDDSAPSSRSQVDGIGGSSGGSVNIECTEDNTGGAIDPSSVVFVGSVVSGTFANLETADGNLHEIDDVGDVIRVVYGYSVGGGRKATALNIQNFMNSISDEMFIKVYDHVGATWDIVAVLDGTNSTTPVQLPTIPLLLKHTGISGAELGKVYVQFDTVTTTPATLGNDLALVSAVNIGQSVGYADGAFWCSDSGVSGTEVYTNGTADNPCPFADALTMNASLPLGRFRITPGSTVTLTSAADSFAFAGSNWSLSLNGQSIDNAYFSGAVVTGIGEATTSRPTFDKCAIAAATIPPAILLDCSIGYNSGTFTAPAGSGEYLFDRCLSAVAGQLSPVMDFSAVTGTTGVNNRGWNGGATYTLNSNCTLSHEVSEGGGTTVTTGGADVEVRGITRELTLVMSAAETIQFVGITGDVNISGTTTGTVKLEGISTIVNDTSVTANVTDNTVRRSEQDDTKTLATTIDSVTSQFAFTEVGLVDANALAIDSNTAAAVVLALSSGVMRVGTVTADTTPTTTAFSASYTEAVNAVSDVERTRPIVWLTGALKDQQSYVEATVNVDANTTTYTVVGSGTNGEMTAAPSTSDQFLIL